MKLILLLTIALIADANAINNPRVSVGTKPDAIMHKENTENIKDLIQYLDNIDSNIDKYKICIDDNLFYVGIGNGNITSDYCYDIINTINSESNFRQTFAGFLSTGTGDISFYNGGGATYHSSLTGRFGADVACNAEYEGSHALVFDDLKYVIATLKLPANIDSAPIWVFDSLDGIYDFSTNENMSKNLTVTQYLNDCDGWKSTSTNDRGMVLSKTTVGSDTFLAIDSQTCSSPARIACIYK